MVILGLGSNMGERLGYLNKAAAGLSDILSGMTISPVYESVAVLPESAPGFWNKPFLNAAVSGETSFAPHELLQFIKSLEKKIGRSEHYQKWSPRVIDIDILAMGNLVMDAGHLKIPHPLLLERPFALLPLADIAPDWQYPGKNISARELAQKSVDTHRTDHKISI